MLNSTWLFCRCASLCTKGRAASNSLKLQNKSLGQCYLSCGVRSRVSNRMGQSPDVPGQARTVQSQNFPGCPRTKQVRVVLLSLLLMKKKIVSPCTFIPDKLLCPGMSWGKITTSLSNKMLKIKSRLLFFFSIFFLLSCVPSQPILWQNFRVQSRPGSLQLHNRDHAILGPAVVAMSARRGTAAKIRGPTFLLQLSYTHGRRDFPLLQFSVSGQRTTSTACRIAKKKAFALQGR